MRMRYPRARQWPRWQAAAMPTSHGIAAEVTRAVPLERRQQPGRGAEPHTHRERGPVLLVTPLRHAQNAVLSVAS